MHADIKNLVYYQAKDIKDPPGEKSTPSEFWEYTLTYFIYMEHLA